MDFGKIDESFQNTLRRKAPKDVLFHVQIILLVLGTMHNLHIHGVEISQYPLTLQKQALSNTTSGMKYSRIRHPAKAQKHLRETKEVLKSRVLSRGSAYSNNSSALNHVNLYFHPSYENI
jgi:hypothetical protein